MNRLLGKLVQHLQLDLYGSQACLSCSTCAEVCQLPCQRLAFACLQAQVKQGMWETTPSNSEALVANFVFDKDHIQDVDTYKAVGTAVSQWLPCCSCCP